MKIKSSLRDSNSIRLYLLDDTVYIKVKRGYISNHFGDEDIGDGDSDIELTLGDLIKLNKWVSKKIKVIEARNKSEESVMNIESSMETQGNAHLIAAAPELFEMLLKTVKVLERVGNDTLDGRNTAEDARELLNKIKELK